MGSRSRTKCRIFPATTPSEDVIKIVFRYFKHLRHLGNCMLVCKLWRDILIRDDYIGRCLWLHQYPALCKAGTSLTDFTKQYVRLILEAREPSPRPRLSLSDLEFYLDIWSDDFEDQRLIFSQVIPLNTLLVGLWSPPPGLHIPDPLVLRHLENRYYMRMFTLVEPRLTMRRPRSIKVSLLVRQKGSGKVACLIRKSASHHLQTGASIAVASDDLCLSPNHPFVPPIRAWMAMLLIEKGQGMIEVFGIDFGFCHANERIVDPDMARRMYFWPQDGNISLDEECVLKLLDMLQWK